MVDQNKMALYKSGLASYTRQDLDGALTAFKKALEMDPNFADVHQSIAHVYEKLGDIDAALDAAKKAVECNPGDFLMHTSLSIFYQRKGMIPEAEAEKALAVRLQSKTGT